MPMNLHISQLPFPRFQGLKHIRDYELPSPLFLEQWIVPKGVTVKLITGRDFGFIVLPQEPQDERGFTIPRRIFKY